jgi:transcriptional regulator with XRE-family HTH domain
VRGTELREIRQEIGWTQERMAEHLGYSVSHYSGLEREERTITPRTAQAAHVLYLVFRLARTLGLLERPSPF